MAPQSLTKLNNKNVESSLNTIFKGSLIVLGGSFAGRFLNLIFKMIAARHFGPEDYGRFSLVLAVIVIGASISSLGMNQTVARFIPYFQEKNEKIKLSYTINFGAKLSLFTSMVIGLVIFIASPWLSKVLNGEKEFTLFLMLFAVVVPFEVVFDYLLGVLRGLKDMKIMALSNNLVLWVVRIVLLGFIVIIGLEIKWMVLPYFISYLVGVAVVLKYIKNKTCISSELRPFAFTKKSKGVRRELLSHSLPLILSTVTTMFRQRFDVILVGFFLTASQVGLYNVALPLAMLMTMFLFAINRIAMPVASELFSRESEDEMEYVYKSISKWSLMVTLPIFFILFVFPENVIFILFGKEYIEASLTLRILSVGYFVNAISGSFGDYLQSFGKTQSVFIISITGTVINLVLMLLLIPRYGIEGAALAICTSMILMCIIGNTYVYRYKKMLPFSKEYFHTITLGTIFFLLVNFIQRYFITFVSDYALTTFIATSLAVYFILVYFLVTNEFDREIIISMIKRSSKSLQQRT